MIGTPVISKKYSLFWVITLGSLLAVALTPWCALARERVMGGDYTGPDPFVFQEEEYGHGNPQYGAGSVAGINDTQGFPTPQWAISGPKGDPEEPPASSQEIFARAEAVAAALQKAKAQYEALEVRILALREMIAEASDPAEKARLEALLAEAERELALLTQNINKLANIHTWLIRVGNALKDAELREVELTFHQALGVVVANLVNQQIFDLKAALEEIDLEKGVADLAAYDDFLESLDLAADLMSVKCLISGTAVGYEQGMKEFLDQTLGEDASSQLLEVALDTKLDATSTFIGSARDIMNNTALSRVNLGPGAYVSVGVSALQLFSTMKKIDLYEGYSSRMEANIVARNFWFDYYRDHGGDFGSMEATIHQKLKERNPNYEPYKPPYADGPEGYLRYLAGLYRSAYYPPDPETSVSSYLASEAIADFFWQCFQVQQGLVSDYETLLGNSDALVRKYQ